MKKILFLFVLSLFSFYKASAQDTIFRNNGSFILCKITGTNNTNVFYKSVTDGKVINSLISRSEVSAVKYGRSDLGNSTAGPNNVSMGIGFGQMFGFVGGKLLIYPQRNIGLFAGAGYDMIGIGYNVGAKLRFIKAESTSRVNFFLTGMYGYVAVIKVEGGEEFNKTFYGPTFGLGIDMKSPSGRGYWTIALLFPVRGTKVQDYMDELKNFHGVEFKNGLIPVTFTVGYMFILN